jgi:hypothetical protein
MIPGDKITCAVYLDDGSTFVVRTRFREQVAMLYASARVTVGIDSFVCDCTARDEGVYWIRGWPALDSEEVTSMLATFALAGDRESALLFRHDWDWDDDFEYHWLYDNPYWDDKLIPQGLVR